MTSRTALVTGSAKRIGAAIIRDLHEHGLDVVVHCHHSIDEAKELVAELNEQRKNSALLVQGDLLQFKHYKDIIRQALSFKNRLDLLVNNASTFFPTPLGQISEKQWQELIGVNLQAPLFLSQHAAPQLLKNGGSIINMTDIHAAQALKDHSAYSSAKAGLDMLTRSLARELAPNVRVNGIALGAVLWPTHGDEDRKQEVLAKTALQRTARLSEVCAAVRFLLDDADYITGQILTLDGGRSRYC